MREATPTNRPSNVILPATSDSIAQSPVDESLREILVLLGKNPDTKLTAENIAGFIGQHVTKVKYHLDRLGKDDYVLVLLNLITPNRYVLTAKGRAFLVEQNLI